MKFSLAKELSLVFLERKEPHPISVVHKVAENVGLVLAPISRIIFIDGAIRVGYARTSILEKMLKQGWAQPALFRPMHAPQRLLHFYEIQFLVESWRGGSWKELRARIAYAPGGILGEKMGKIEGELVEGGDK